MKIMQSEDGTPVPGTEAWLLPCGCWAWKWAGVESWLPCQPHVMTHNSKRQQEFAMSYEGFGVEEGKAKIDRACTCLLCLAEKHGDVSPYEFARLVARQGIHEHQLAEQAKVKTKVRDLFAAPQGTQTVAMDASEFVKMLAGAQQALMPGSPEPEIHFDVMRCGCQISNPKGEWRVTKPCKKHKRETKANRRRREQSENERRDR